MLRTLLAIKDSLVCFEEHVDVDIIFPSMCVEEDNFDDCSCYEIVVDNSVSCVFGLGSQIPVCSKAYVCE